MTQELNDTLQHEDIETPSSEECTDRKRIENANLENRGENIEKESKPDSQEASKYIFHTFEGKSLKERIKIIKREWFGSAINPQHLTSIITSFLFYKCLFSFLTRFLEIQSNLGI